MHELSPILLDTKLINSTRWMVTISNTTTLINCNFAQPVHHFTGWINLIVLKTVAQIALLPLTISALGER